MDFTRIITYGAKIPHIGSVIIEDNVEIGSGTTIDRGLIDCTHLMNNCKIDNLVHIAHNVVVGSNTAIAACTGIAGSTTIGNNNCTIGGGVGINGHITICDDVHIHGMSMITKSITSKGEYASAMAADTVRTGAKIKYYSEIFSKKIGNKNMNITNYLPHRYPFLLIDKIIDIKKGEMIVAQKNVSNNEPFFQGHFPEYPVFPGVLLLEAMAQATAILDVQSNDRDMSKYLYYFVGIDNARFKKQVVPGDIIIISAELIQSKSEVHKFKADCKIDNDIVCKADLIGAIRPKDDT